QSVGRGPDLTAHAALLPDQHCAVGPHAGEQGGDVVAVADDHAIDAADLAGLRAQSEAAGGTDGRPARHGTGARDLADPGASGPRASRAFARRPRRRAAPASARPASGPGQVTSRAEERPGSVSEPWARKAPRQAASASATDPLTMAEGRPRTGLPRLSTSPVWRARAPPSRVTRSR